MDISLFYWGNDDGSDPLKYQLLLLSGAPASQISTASERFGPPSGIFTRSVALIRTPL